MAEEGAEAKRELAAAQAARGKGEQKTAAKMEQILKAGADVRAGLERAGEEQRERMQAEVGLELI
jgi:hypothetical protein